MLKTKRSTRLEMRAQIFKSLAHPTRLMIVEELARGERCVCELQALVGCDMSTISKHLSLLRNVGILTMDKRGNQVFYKLEIPCILRIFDCVEQTLRARLQKHAELLSE